jgi:hypothetical protein
MTVLLMLIAQLGLVAYLVTTGYFTAAMLISLAGAFSLPRVFRVYRNPRPTEAPPELPKGVWPLYFVAVTFWYNRRFGAFFLVALALDIVISRMT